jgi:DNA-binding HxlR family transcriptional regulator
MDETGEPTKPDCKAVNEILGRIGDKWTIQVLVSLIWGPRRFNEVKRQVGGISQQMLTRTLRQLERDGMAERIVRPSRPPHVEYALTPFGHSLSETVKPVADWASMHQSKIESNRIQYDALND